MKMTSRTANQTVKPIRNRFAPLRNALALIAGLSSICMSVAAAGYEVTEEMLPTDLRMHLELDSVPIHNNFTRRLVFHHEDGSRKVVPVRFSRSSHLVYEGAVTHTGLARLKSIVEPDNRSFWDAMTFENAGGSTALVIRRLEIEIEYANTCCGREEWALIGLVENQYLDAGTSVLTVDSEAGRRGHAIDHLGLTTDEFLALPVALREFLHDVGKSGSSASPDGERDEKYTDGDDQSLCSETVSWYYHQFGVRIDGEDFRDIHVHSQIHDAFHDADRLYCYHASRDQWIKRDADYHWVYGDTYVPRPGDYLDRKSTGTSSGDDGHAMVIVDWDESRLVAETIDGPYNINFRPVDVDAHEDAGTDYCVGRIPFND